MITKEGLIICPRPRGLEPIQINLVKIKEKEARLDEIAFVNLTTAPELLCTFNKVYMELSEYISILEYEKNRAERDAQSRRSVVMLDEMPRLLKEKGLATDRSPSGSSDTREAILDQDRQYQAALEIVEQINAVSRLLKDKRDGFVMAYNAVKRILEKTSLGMSRTINGAPESNLDVGDQEDDSYGFGTAR